LAVWCNSAAGFPRIPIIFKIFWKICLHIHHISPNVFNSVYSGFSGILETTDYDNENSLKEVYEHTIVKLKEYESGHPLPRSHNRSQITNLLPLLIASMQNGKISVLDYGGGMGFNFQGNLKKGIGDTINLLKALI